MKSFIEKIKKGIEIRFGFDFSNVLETLQSKLKKQVTQNITFLNSFGLIIIILFVILIITGLLLSFYYKPTPEDAYVSVKYIMNQVPYGWLIRSIHHWASHLFVLFVFLHFWRVFFTGAYKFPRELLYISGIINLLFVFLFVFTGGLLKWDNDSYWTTNIMTSELKDLPFLGEYLRLFIRGGVEVGSGTLTRFFVAHIVLLPGIFLFLIALHLTMVVRQGVSSWKERTSRMDYPVIVLLIDILIIIFGIFTALVILSVFFPAPLGELADPLRQPAVVEPSWFMLPLYRIYKAIPTKIWFFTRFFLFSSIFLFLLIVIILLPFVDKGPERHPLKRPVQGIIGLIFIVMALFLIFYKG